MIDFRNSDQNDKNSTNTNYNQEDLSKIPVSHKTLMPLSPYLNFDPSYLPPSQPEFIFPEGAVKQRGRFELAFSQIGGTCMAGAAIGGVTGLYKGIYATSLAGQQGKLRRTQLINHVVKHGASMANTLGVVSVMYTCFGVFLSYVRGHDDSINTLAAATATGMLFKSTAGLKKCAMGGGVGLGIASLYCLWSNREAFTEFRHHSMNPASK
ncbi:mitochondrial import inner membrane translocase subunit Tim23 isoform X1 [Leptopilina heterotoma]|uniref:mitochondrial import inner membrane translocase subunit Tim23 isoform X1 n=2 Tax=Leptopilina heterotoma TaxID=63436 RepID=UPI001CA7F117|nr:mitochondrial import inner membrane translocase subunit Tim23 isoform X1 [Leptopilina heterotoma]